MTDKAMLLALDYAARAAASAEVPVGAVIVDPDTDEIISAAHNAPVSQHDPTAHAEILALRAAARQRGNYRLTGLHIHVTLEPCAMCAGAISLARLGRLVFAARDPKGGGVLHGPCFFDQPTCHWRPEIIEASQYAPQASQLLKDFFRARR